MTDPIEFKKDEISEELESVVANAREMAEEMGLNPRDVSYWVVDQDEINELAAYGGFQNRYPHWRWGMNYDKRQKTSEFMGGKIFEMVINDTPCHAYLQMSNSIADQKSVITHVEGHSDFFANNEWFQDEPDASEMLDRHAERIREFANDPNINRDELEEWIDHISCIEDTIDQHSRNVVFHPESKQDKDEVELNLDIDESIEEFVFRNEEENENELRSIEESYIDGTVSDVVGFLMENGQRYDSGSDRAEPFEDWQREVLEMMREEAYYFAPQKMTKVMNEGWAKYVESYMMTFEGVADTSDIFNYADHSSGVLNSPGFNPYSLGLALWEHIENTVNRREVVDKLLRIDGVTPDNFHDVINFQSVHDAIEDNINDDDIIERHYSLTRLKNRGFIKSMSVEDVRKCNRYIMEGSRYTGVQEAISDVDLHRGWERMKEIRETHNDTMFLDEFVTQEFVDDQQMYTYEYRSGHQEMEIASRDVEDVRKKLLVQFTNFGKPTIEVASDNYDNSGELLLLHRYNGIMMNLDEAEDVLERIYQMWGRPVNIATIRKSVTERQLKSAARGNGEPEPDVNGIRIRYDGEEFQEEELEDIIEEEVKSSAIDYDTRPSEWY